jgi:peptide/nickel transport system substrate-binding protein
MVSPVFAQTPVKGGTLTVCQPAEPPGLNPTTHTAAAIDRVVYANIYEGLVKVDSGGGFIPGLAKGWQVSASGLVYTFTLRKGVVFHNGDAFDAAVAKWNLERASVPENGNPHPEYFNGIDHIATPDSHTLEVHLKNVDALFIAHMAEGDAVMLPMRGPETEANAQPIGTGAFKFTKWERGDRVEMERNQNYWNPDLPYLDKVTIRFITDVSAQIAALKAGDVDVHGLPPGTRVSRRARQGPAFQGQCRHYHG